MRITLIRPALLLIVSIGTAAAQQGNAPAATPRPAAPILRLTAPGFSDGGPIAKQNTCQGAESFTRTSLEQCAQGCRQLRRDHARYR